MPNMIFSNRVIILLRYDYTIYQYKNTTPEGKRSLGRHTRRREDDIKMDLK
jgi:hypothetical protein